MSGEKKPTNTRILLFFFGFVFLFFLVFSLGVIVGKGLSNKNSNKIITKDSSKRQNIEEIPERSIENELKEYDTELKQETVKTETVDKQQPVKEVKVEKEVSKDEKIKDVLESVKGTKKETKVANVGSNFPETDKNGKYTIQIGSFKDKNSAQKALNLYQAKGYPAFIKEYNPEDKVTWYRLRIGTFNDKTKAKKYSEVLKNKEDNIATYITVNY
ncbi:MAG: hypothetical protein GTO02_06575 [Candidatus Dadabacteria bacterium]|nr:hypothetical protein [Candidatus Dadabacteria bacterium]NIQ14066.1 hypothetical protein [Candidatus Dadabacteria bacterium]